MNTCKTQERKTAISQTFGTKRAIHTLLVYVPVEAKASKTVRQNNKYSKKFTNISTDIQKDFINNSA